MPCREYDHYEGSSSSSFCNLLGFVRKMFKYFAYLSSDVLLHMGSLVTSCINLDFQIINANTYFALTHPFIPN